MLSILLAAIIACATALPSPEDVAAAYLLSLQRGDFDEAAALIHPDVLTTTYGAIRDQRIALFNPSLDPDFEARTDTLYRLASTADARSVYAYLLRMGQGSAAVLEPEAAEAFTILGAVRDGAWAHVLWREADVSEEDRPGTVKRLTLRLHHDGWWVWSSA